MTKNLNKLGAIVIGLIIAIFCVVLFLPSLRWMVNSWISSDYYSHGFLVPFISAYFIWINRKHLKERKPSAFGVLFFVLALVLYLLNLILAIRVLGILSLLCIVFGLVIVFWGLKAAKALMFPLGFLIFMVPFWFIQDLAFRLQYLSVSWAAWIAKMFGLPIITTGSEIHMGDVTFTVGIVCSGINTLVALLALSAVYCYVLKGSLPKRFGLFVLAFPIAILANIFRIASIIIVAYFFDVKTATGWYHDISSPLFFAISFLILVLIGWLMKLGIGYEKFNKQ
jgi:exosortase